MICLPASLLGKLAQIFRSSVGSYRSSEQFEVAGEEMTELVSTDWTGAAC
jgi:hypothetical protein